jgi:Uma2 family endonuclease
MSTFAPAKTRIVYPESDGKPMAENTRQYECIVALQGGLDELVADFVGADNFWYPMEGHPEINTAPDVYVAIGRPKEHRGSYQTWNEGGINPQIVFEVLSPGNRGAEMARKFRFYNHYGVEEYYIYDPDDNTWAGFRREGGELVEIAEMGAWVSPRLGIRFDVEAPEMRVLRPDGKPFLTYRELAAERKREEEARKREEEARKREEEARIRAEARAAAAEQTVEQLRSKLRAAGIDPNA